VHSTTEPVGPSNFSASSAREKDSTDAPFTAMMWSPTAILLHCCAGLPFSSDLTDRTESISLSRWKYAPIPTRAFSPCRATKRSEVSATRWPEKAGHANATLAKQRGSRSSDERREFVGLHTTLEIDDPPVLIADLLQKPHSFINTRCRPIRRMRTPRLQQDQGTISTT
jgi:hypothetical protein